MSNDKKTELKKEDVIKDKEFIQKTFKKLYDCHQDGCGEEPDHDGYFNAGKTVAVESINQILELSLLDESNSDSKWLKQEELLGLLSVENKKTRSLSLTHLLKKSASDPLAKEALYDTVKGLKDNGFVDAVTGIAKYDGHVDSNEFVDLLSAGFITTSNHGVIESIYELNTKLQLDEQQFQKVSTGLCKRIQDINAKSIATGMNKWAEYSGHGTKIEDVCSQ